MEAAASTRPCLKKAQTNTFFTSYKQMEVAKEMLVQLGKRGIKEVKDLAEFNKDIWKQVVENLKHPGGWMMNPDRESDQSHTMVLQTPYLFGARTQKRLVEASEQTRYYKTVVGWPEGLQMPDTVCGPKDHRRVACHIGVRTIPLSYMTRATALASRPASVHRDHLPHGEKFNYIEEKL
eukprot:12880378-Ditylum_brightwellii.AAC.1